MEDVLRFVPSSSKGWPEVTEVVIRPDRLEFQMAGEWKTFAFDDLAQLPYPRHNYPRWRRKLWQFFDRRCCLFVGDRDWFHEEGEKFFLFYTEPRLIVCLPAEQNVDYTHSLFRRVQNILQIGGYMTMDLG